MRERYWVSVRVKYGSEFRGLLSRRHGDRLKAYPTYGHRRPSVSPIGFRLVRVVGPSVDFWPVAGGTPCGFSGTMGTVDSCGGARLSGALLRSGLGGGESVEVGGAGAASSMRTEDACGVCPAMGLGRTARVGQFEFRGGTPAPP